MDMNLSKLWEKEKDREIKSWNKRKFFRFYYLKNILIVIASLVFSLQCSCSVQVSSIQSLSRAWLFVTPGTAAHQASLSITNSRSLFKLMSIESTMPSNHLILSCPLLLLPSIFPSIWVFSNESVLCIRWPKYGSLQLQNRSFQGIFRTDFL